MEVNNDPSIQPRNDFEQQPVYVTAALHDMRAVDEKYVIGAQLPERIEIDLQYAPLNQFQSREAGPQAFIGIGLDADDLATAVSPERPRRQTRGKARSHLDDEVRLEGAQHSVINE